MRPGHQAAPLHLGRSLQSRPEGRGTFFLVKNACLCSQAYSGVGNITPRSVVKSRTTQPWSEPSPSPGDLGSNSEVEPGE